MKYARRVTRSSQVSRSLLIQAAELKSSTDVSTEQQKQSNFVLRFDFLYLRLNPCLEYRVTDRFSAEGDDLS